jgi:hypothetical protein
MNLMAYDGKMINSCAPDQYGELDLEKSALSIFSCSLS